jgi:hypothetical protein
MRWLRRACSELAMVGGLYEMCGITRVPFLRREARPTTVGTHCRAQASGCAAAWWALSPEYRRHPPTEGYARVLTGTGTGLTHGWDSARVGLNGTRLTPCRA